MRANKVRSISVVIITYFIARDEYLILTIAVFGAFFLANMEF